MKFKSDAGIVAIEVYLPRLIVDQAGFEAYSQTPQGKYTIGLGMTTTTLVGPLEDVNSMALTVLRKLLTRTKIDPKKIGKIEFATETIHDKSKSSKTILLSLFKDHKDIEGVTHINACYGGTSAFFDCINWVQSDYGKGKYAIVVMSDVSVYEEPEFLALGGGGAVAVLIGENPGLLFGDIRASFSDDEYDFYKPRLEVEYPLFDAALSIALYEKGVEQCFEGIVRKTAEKGGSFGMKDLDYYLLHCPTPKQVEKGVSKIIHSEIRSGKLADFDPPIKNSDMRFADLNRIIKKKFEKLFLEKVEPGLTFNRIVGNIYTGSLYLCLLSLICSSKPESLVGKKVFMYSYGSGVCASAFVMKFSDNLQLVKNLVDVSETSPHVMKREVIPIEDYVKLFKERESLYNKFDFVSDVSQCPRQLRPGTYFLKEVTVDGKRVYEYFEGSENQNSKLNSLRVNLLSGSAGFGANLSGLSQEERSRKQ